MPNFGHKKPTSVSEVGTALCGVSRPRGGSLLRAPVGVNSQMIEGSAACELFTLHTVAANDRMRERAKVAAEANGEQHRTWGSR